MKGFITIKWNDEKQKFFVGHIGTFIDYKGNEFIAEEECFPTEKTEEEIINFLMEINNEV